MLCYHLSVTAHRISQTMQARPARPARFFSSLLKLEIRGYNQQFSFSVSIFFLFLENWTGRLFLFPAYLTPIWGFPSTAASIYSLRQNWTPRKNIISEKLRSRPTHFDSLFNASERDYYEWVVLTILTRWMVMYCLSSHYFSLLSLSFSLDDRWDSSWESERGGGGGGERSLQFCRQPRRHIYCPPLLRERESERECAAAVWRNGDRPKRKKNVLSILFIVFFVSSGCPGAPFIKLFMAVYYSTSV
jgi:hypothetical protein